MKKHILLSALFLCIFLNAPILRAQAKTRKSYVFTISEFEKEANKIAKDIENDTSVIPGVDKCEVFVFKSETEFIDKWNSIEEAEEIIIDCHGNNSIIGTSGTEIRLNRTMISQLNCINCKRVVILACSTFSTDNFNNIAISFVTRITGRKVIASDGTVFKAGLTNIFSSDMNFRTFGNWYMIRESDFKKLDKKCYSIIDLAHIN